MANGQYLEPYWAIMKALWYSYRDDGCRITRDEFDGGLFLICSDLSPTQCNSIFDDPIQSGNLDCAKVLCTSS